MAVVLLLSGAMALDLLLGDPRWLPHPVRAIAWWAWRVEGLCRRLVANETLAGCLTMICVLGMTGIAAAGLLFAAGSIYPAAETLLALLLLSSAIALKDLLGHARAVLTALTGPGDAIQRLQRGRQSVAMLVGRDTQQLDEAGVVRACVESLAENLSDGVTAPLCWATAGALTAAALEMPPEHGAVVAAMLYKAINTMDSLFGYTNERYRRFGRCPARLDDLANLLPARLSALSLILAASLTRASAAGAWRIWRRDHANHASPNSGHPEAALAGALGIQLGGPASYFGQMKEKPRIGDALTPLTVDHISSTCHLVRLAGILTLPCCLAICAWVL